MKGCPTGAALFLLLARKENSRRDAETQREKFFRQDEQDGTG